MRPGQPRPVNQRVLWTSIARTKSRRPPRSVALLGAPERSGCRSPHSGIPAHRCRVEMTRARRRQELLHPRGSCTPPAVARECVSLVQNTCECGSPARTKAGRQGGGALIHTQHSRLTVRPWVAPALSEAFQISITSTASGLFQSEDSLTRCGGSCSRDESRDSDQRHG
jgi:hypothetical protein